MTLLKKMPSLGLQQLTNPSGLKINYVHDSIPSPSDFTKNFVLECDASGKGIGVVLMKDVRPLDFTNKQLSDRHLGQSIYEKEMLSILHAVDIWRLCLLG
jgi:hypothetical protein